MKKFSQLKPIRRINEQEVTLAKDVEGTNQSTVKVEIHSDGTTTSTTDSQEVKTAQEEPKEEVKAEGSVVKFFSKLFESREMAHVYHLTVKGEEGSHAKHLALGNYYESVIGMIDELVEVHQGEFEVIEGYESIDTSSAKSTDAIKYFQDLAEFVKKERKVCFEADATHYFNIIDDIMVLIYKTLYKLKYNK
jgi:hypothetical protein